MFLLAAGCEGDRRAQGCDPPCGEYQVCSDGVCRDLDCNPRCTGGRACVNGFCLRECAPGDDAACGHSETCCAHVRVCIDTSTDFQNCGGCGLACSADAANECFRGTCRCGGYSMTPCTDGSSCCDDGCKDLMTDVENCGSCGHACGGLQCVDGACRCSSDEPCPEGEECCVEGCRDLRSDPSNCGACGGSCEGGQDCCGGECANTFSDARHCGDCGSACSEGEECCLGMCTDTRTDQFNCGECLNDCGTGGTCVDGQCG